MIVTKTPLRVPLAGGLTDLKGFADRFGGVTLSATIDKYIFIAVKRNLASIYDLHYLNANEKATEIEGIRHNHIREAIKLVGVEAPLDIAIMNDLQHEGGLGSSGALTAGLLSALHGFNGESPEPGKIVSESSKIEMDILEGASGYHDHSITQLGGFRLIRYEGGKPTPEPTGIPDETVDRFMRRLMLFYSGFHAKTKPSLALLAENLESVIPRMNDIKQNAFMLRDMLIAGNLDEAGACVQRQQDLKQKLPGSFENEFVIDTMHRAKKLGVMAQIPGGKIGSFLLVYRPLGMKRKDVLRHFADLKYLPFRFEPSGTKITSI